MSHPAFHIVLSVDRLLTRQTLISEWLCCTVLCCDPCFSATANISVEQVHKAHLADDESYNPPESTSTLCKLMQRQASSTSKMCAYMKERATESDS